MSTLSFPVFSNKGLAINIESFHGDVSISKSVFQQNMFHVPGVAYTPSRMQNLSFDSFKLNSKFFK